MINQINGQHFHNLIDYGIRNLALHKDRVNALNVFPVPDGDTGTNMVMTLQNGFGAIRGSDDCLSEMAKRFSGAVVFGARGNSGVIVSQFFKGLSETFFEIKEADCHRFAAALTNGVKYAYASVSEPVEGTVLTVLREAAAYAADKLAAKKIDSIDSLLAAFLKKARVCLENTPELLPILKSAGVVDSGAAGVVYVFEGMEKYLKNEPLSEVELYREEAVDYSAFDRTSTFDYGYCTELLLQLTDGKADFDESEFSLALAALGDSLVTAAEGDKVKIHIHTHTPEKILAFCHDFGEFLSLKIENMSVQHHEFHQIPRIGATNRSPNFSVVAVAHDPATEKRFLEMGADAVIPGNHRCPPSASDFIDAFRQTASETILVFPNSKNSELAAKQAQTLYPNTQIIVFATRSDAECYAALPMIDFESNDMQALANEIEETISNVHPVKITRAVKDTVFDGKSVQIGEYVALDGDALLAVDASLFKTASSAAKEVLDRCAYDILTVFTHRSVPETEKNAFLRFVSEKYPYTETDIIETEDNFYHMVLSFE